MVDLDRAKKIVVMVRDMTNPSQEFCDEIADVLLALVEETQKLRKHDTDPCPPPDAYEFQSDRIAAFLGYPPSHGDE